jgi:hypothetical protein
MWSVFVNFPSQRVERFLFLPLSRLLPILLHNYSNMYKKLHYPLLLCDESVVDMISIRFPFATRCNLVSVTVSFVNLGMQQRNSAENHFESGVLQLPFDLFATMYVCMYLSLSLSFSLCTCVCVNTVNV